MAEPDVLAIYGHHDNLLNYDSNTSCDVDFRQKNVNVKNVNNERK